MGWHTKRSGIKSERMSGQRGGLRSLFGSCPEEAHREAHTEALGRESACTFASLGHF